MPLDIVLGLQRGDEGKGRFVDFLARDYDIVARFNGGPNAGHRIADENREPLTLHQVPAGIAHAHILNIIGNGVLVDPIKLLAEVATIRKIGLDISPSNLVVSDQAHLILPHHIILDKVREATSKGQGSTKCGIAYAASDKYLREGARAELIKDNPEKLYKIVLQALRLLNIEHHEANLPPINPDKLASEWLEQALKVKDYIDDTVGLLHDKLNNGARALGEGAQAFGLDIEHGMYPFVTSSHASIGGAINGLGVGPHQIGRVIGVVKLVRSNLGGGPFVTKIEDVDLVQTLRGIRGEVDAEYGGTTGRESAIGYLDLPEIRHAIAVNGVTELAFIKLDTLARFNGVTKVAIAYELNGKIIKLSPSSASRLGRCIPVYKELYVWNDDIGNARNFNDLPKKAKELIEFIADELGVKVTMISVGPEREQVITMKV